MLPKTSQNGAKMGAEIDEKTFQKQNRKQKAGFEFSARLLGRPRGPKSSPRGPKSSPRGPKRPQEAPREAPRRLQEAPREAQERPREAQELPREPQELPREPQERPRGPKSRKAVLDQEAVCSSSLLAPTRPRCVMVARAC